MGAWGGSPASRQRVPDGAAAAGAAEPVVLTDDVHVHCGPDLAREPDNPDAGVAGVEVVTASIAGVGTAPTVPTTTTPSCWWPPTRTGAATTPAAAVSDTPSVRTHLRADHLRADPLRGGHLTLPHPPAVTRPGAPATVTASLVTAGDPHLTEA